MNFPSLEYLAWAKAQPPVAINLARSGIDSCPPSLLELTTADLVTTLPVRYGYAPLKEAIGRRYGVSSNRVFTVSGGTGFANYVACAAALDGAPRGSTVLVERPTYEPLLRVPEAFGHQTRRFDRRFEDAYAVDVDAFAASVTSRTRLALVTNLHNPSGARIPMAVMKDMARILARVGAYLLVDEVYLECVFRDRAHSSVHAGKNVIVTNSLTKAYGLDGLRAGWMLGPRELVVRAGRINDLMTNNGVAPGERMSLAAFKHHRAIDARAHGVLDPNLAIVTSFLKRETRLAALVPEGGNVAFPRLPRNVDGERFAKLLVRKYSTLVVPGRFFESPQHFRISFGCAPDLLKRGLSNISAALDAAAR
jgi:aspartate/methionine/tyrosine aminotransferase